MAGHTVLMRFLPILIFQVMLRPHAILRAWPDGDKQRSCRPPVHTNDSNWQNSNLGYRQGRPKSDQMRITDSSRDSDLQSGNMVSKFHWHQKKCQPETPTCATLILAPSHTTGA
jgi:hypothetical protein